MNTKKVVGLSPATSWMFDWYEGVLAPEAHKHRRLWNEFYDPAQELLGFIFEDDRVREEVQSAIPRAVLAARKERRNEILGRIADLEEMAKELREVLGDETEQAPDEQEAEKP